MTLQSGIIILFVFYLQKQTLLATDNLPTAIDEMINASMEASVQPCEDFYGHACGNYNEQIFFNASLDNKTLFEYADHQYNTAIMDLLKTHERQEHQTGVPCLALLGKVRNYYESCRKVGQRNLTRYLEELKPGSDLNWPILENERSQTTNWPHGKDFDVFQLLGKLRSLGIEQILNVNTFGDAGFAITVFSSELNILTVEKILQDVLTFKELKSPLGLLYEIMETNRKLKHFLDNEESGEDEESLNQLNDYELITYGGLIERYPNVNFKAYFMEFLGKKLPTFTRILLYNPFIMQKLNDKITIKFEKSQLCNYLMIHYLRVFDVITEFDTMRCLKNTREMFNMAVNFLYYHHNIELLEKLVKPDVTEIFRTVADMLAKHVASHELQLTIYQIKSIEKELASVRLNIGDLPDNATCETIEQFYSTVPAIEENNYYRNHLLMLRFILPKYVQPHIQATTDSATLKFYNSQLKRITLNYAHLMPPIYGWDYNSLGKYSVLGLILAKSLLQHFNIVNLNQWHNSSPLYSAIECLRQQPHVSYANIYDRVEDNVASEIVRKLVTLKFFNLQPIESVAFWKKHFYLNVAQQYCCTHNNQSHSDQGNRLNLIARNNEGFSQAFNCSEGSKMNPKAKCKI